MVSLLSVDPIEFKQRNETFKLEHDQAALLAVLKVFESWEITTELWSDILEGLPNQVLVQSNKYLQSRLTSDQRARISIILSCDRVLRRLFLQNKHRVEWIHNKHESLNGNSPLDVLACGSLIALYELHRHVQSLPYL